MRALLSRLAHRIGEFLQPGPETLSEAGLRRLHRDIDRGVTHVVYDPLDAIADAERRILKPADAFERYTELRDKDPVFNRLIERLNASIAEAYLDAVLQAPAPSHPGDESIDRLHTCEQCGKNPVPADFSICDECVTKRGQKWDYGLERCVGAAYIFPDPPHEDHVIVVRSLTPTTNPETQMVEVGCSCGDRFSFEEKVGVIEPLHIPHHDPGSPTMTTPEVGPTPGKGQDGPVERIYGDLFADPDHPHVGTDPREAGQ